MSTITAEAAGTQRGQVDDAEGAVGTHGPDSIAHIHNVFVPGDQQDTDEGARVDALLEEQIRDWSTPELQDYVALDRRHLGGYHTYCHDAAAAELDRRRREFNPDFLRYSMLEDGCGDFAGLSDAEVTSAVKGLGVDEDEEDPERWDGQS